MMQLGRADDRRGNRLLLQHPRQRDLRARHAAFGGDLADPFDDPPVRIFRLRIERAAEFIGLGARAFGVPVAASDVPRASGLHGITPMPSVSHSGSISRSSSRYSRL